MDPLFREMEQVLSSTLARLVLAAILGGVIGLERQLRHKPAGLRTNMFICLGAAMFTVLSRELAGGPSDSARIAAQIIPGIGFIGAGSILHARGSVTGLTTAATLFVVASVGMAVGGGLYITAAFATVLILLALAVLGKLEAGFSLKTLLTTFEVTGTSVESMLREVNRSLEDQKLTMQSVHLASTDGQSRMTFAVECGRDERNVLSVRLHESNVFASVSTVGSLEHE
ncbi:MAG TPA: MgtC/SapB family protein [Terriglobales bacterium]|nr:MgtC/SapB family protein [Terriglobales bacterium]